jgi:hydroxymethylpyrimidine pyrophosphatase-like HAD family hydrolase
MPYRYRGFAIDFDGTLTEDGEPAPDVLDAVAEVRKAGRRVVLVTGRILDELEAVFPDVARHFDAVVAENGAVLDHGGVRLLAEPIDEMFAQALETHGVPFRRGHVLLATTMQHHAVIAGEIGRLGLELQLVRNRNELMVLPTGINKGTGLLRALRELDLSPHNVVALGDAENDHSLFVTCEIGVAVANAVDALKAHAEVELTQPNGVGVAAFLRQVLRGDLALVRPTRWDAVLGEFDGGQPVGIPATSVAIGVFGESGRGKSYLAGLLAERLVRLGYLICVLDPEGDHADLAQLPGVVCVGGDHPLPAEADVTEIIVRGGASVVVDMSQHEEGSRARYARDLLAACQTARERHGVPHCIILDEAHIVFDDTTAVVPMAVDAAGLCLITWRPSLLSPDVHSRLDCRITVRSVSEAVIEGPFGEPARRFTPATRECRHGRHSSKYLATLLPAHRRFHFRSRGLPVGRSAGGLREFRDEFALAPDSVLVHHATHRDFSRWIGDLCRDPRVAGTIRRLEGELAEKPDGRAVAHFREELIATIAEQYAI